jgi:predicted PurR-regulated permease PerM
MKVRIEIDTKTFVRFWLVVIGFGLAGLMIYQAREALIILGTALFLAIALSYPVKKIAHFLPGKSRVGGTALAFTSLIVVLSAVVWFVIPPIVQQSAKFAETLPALGEQVNTQWVGIGDFIDQNGLREQVNETLENIKHESSTWAADAGKNVLNGVGSFASFLVAALLVIVLTFLMLIEGPTWMDRLWRLYSDKSRMRHHKSLVDKTYNVVTGYINGQLTISGIGSLVAGACVFILSLIFPAIDGNLAMPTILLTFVLTLIPMFGATLAGVLITLLLLLNDPTAGIIYGIFFVVYQQIENNFISPVVQAKKVELSALAVLVSVTIGFYVGGLIGGVIAIPIAGTVKVFADDYLSRKRSTQAADDKPIAKFVKKVTKRKSSTA